MKKLLGFMLILSSVLLAGCGFGSTNTDPTVKNSVHHPLQVVTSFYPLYQIAQKVGGDQVTVENLVPAGAEPHDYEPTPKDVIGLHEADLIIYNGSGLEPWSEKMIPELVQKGTAVLNQSELFPNGGGDPHFWLDPVSYKLEVSAVSEKMALLDPAHKNFYDKNAEDYIQNLADLNTLYAQGLKNCVSRIVVTNHAAFGYLSQRYGLTMVAVSGFSPESEPSSQALSKVINTIREKKVKAIFTETLLSPKVAETIAAETGAHVLVLNPLEGLTDTELAQGKDYISVMKENLKNLQTGLECQS